MKVLSLHVELPIYQKVFNQLKASKSPVVIWQVFPEKGERVINEATLLSYDLEGQLLNLSLLNHFLDPKLPVYCYVEDQCLIFKSTVQAIKDDQFSTLFPQQMKVLEEEDFHLIKSNTGLDLNNLWVAKTGAGNNIVDEIWRVKSMAQRSKHDQDFLNNEFDHLSVDEEDKMFADKRESPRVRPKVQKIVKLVKKGEDSVNFFDLFDLSRGGMSFVTSIPDHYPKGTEVKIVGFDTFDLDDPLIGTVMSVRPIDGSGIDVKIGIKFHDGQG